MNIDNKIDKNIIEFVLKLLNVPYESYKYFTDGVSSHVILLNNKYLIKRSTPYAIKAEIKFLSLKCKKLFILTLHIDLLFMNLFTEIL